jgi:hypothetical protein
LDLKDSCKKYFKFEEQYGFRELRCYDEPGGVQGTCDNILFLLFAVICFFAYILNISHRAIHQDFSWTPKVCNARRPCNLDEMAPIKDLLYANS